MPYEEERRYILDHIANSNRLNKQSCDISKDVLSSTIDMSILQLVQNTVTADIHWEAVLIKGKYVIVFSEHDKFVIYSGNHNSRQIQELDFRISTMSVSLNFGMIHIFVGSSTGTLRHFYYEPDEDRLVATFQTIFDDGLFVVPCAFQHNSHHPQYFWTIGVNSVKFYVLLKSILYTAVIFNVEQDHSFHFLHAESIRDERDDSIGVAIYYYAKSKNELSTLVLDGLPAILYCEKEFREAMNIREVNGLRPIVSPMNASTKTLHTPWVLTTQIIHDYALDYSNIFKSLSSCDKNFSWSAHIVHCDGSISKVQYQSKQYQLRVSLAAHGEHLLSSLSTDEDISSHKFIHNHHHEVISFSLQSPAINARTLSHHQPTDLKSIWETLTDSPISLISRKNVNIDRKDEFWKRVLILEALVGLDLAHVIFNAVTRKDSTAFNERYRVADVQRIFDWVAGASPSSVLNHTITMFKEILREKTIPMLCNRQYIPDYEDNSSIDLLLAHREVVSASHALITIAEALLQRKRSIIELTTSTNYDFWHAPLTHDLVSQSLVELFLLFQEVKVFEKVVTFALQMVRDESITFSMFGFSQNGGKDCGTLAKEHNEGRRCQHPNMKGVLPTYLESNTLLFDLFVEQLPSEFAKHCKFYEWNGNEREEKLANLLLLPHSVVHSRCAVLTSLKRPFVSRTLQQLAEDIDEDFLKAIRVVLYLLLDSNNASNALLHSVVPMVRQVEIDTHSLSTILNIDQESIQNIQAVQYIDSGTNLKIAIERFCYSTGIAYLESNEFILPMIKRLLTSGHHAYAHEFIRALAVRDHRVLSTKEGSVAVAIAQPAKGIGFEDQPGWRMTWNASKKCILNVKPAIEAYQASVDATHFITLWAIRHKSLSDLLNSDLDLGEIETIIASLMLLVNEDLKESRTPSSAVDTLFAFLLRHFRIDDARKLHEDHVKSISASKMAAANDDSIRDRAALLKGFSIVDLPPLIDYETKINLSRTKTLLK